MTIACNTTSDALAATIAEALDRHVPDFQSIHYEQLMAVTNDVLARWELRGARRRRIRLGTQRSQNSLQPSRRIEQ
jgi:hypothetical protein